MLIDDKREHAADQEHFITKFIEDNVRHTTNLQIASTLVEAVAFDVILSWRAKITYNEVEQHGSYGGDGYTHYTNTYDDLQIEVDTYAQNLLVNERTYDVVHAHVTSFDDIGFSKVTSQRVRREKRNFAWVRECNRCHGSGRVSCYTCNGSGQINCSACSGSGRNTCGLCSGRGQLSYQETIYVGSSSQSVTKWRSCSCMNGTVTCNSCGGSRRQTCTFCSGSGSVTCNKCSGHGTLSTLRTMDLMVTPKRELIVGSEVSAFARDALREYQDPRDIPRSTYSGFWNPDATLMIDHRSISFTKNAKTRFLKSIVLIDSHQFEFKTFGESLHILDGGRLVEYLLGEDSARLADLVTSPFRALLANPFMWFRFLLSATSNVLASRINVHLFNRFFGSKAAAEIIRSVSESYALDIVRDLRKSFRYLLSLTSTSVWILAYLSFLTLLIINLHKHHYAFSVHELRLTILALNYTSIFAIIGVGTLAYILSRTLCVLSFVQKRNETALKSLTLVRGKVRNRTVALYLVLTSLISAVYIFA